MYWSTTYTDLNGDFKEAANRAWDHLATGMLYELLGAGQCYVLDTTENAPELFAYMMGTNLDNVPPNPLGTTAKWSHGMDRIDLNVPFADKDAAKASGARWDALNRTWYWPGSEIPEALAQYAIPGLRSDSAIMADVAARVSEIVADLPAAYDRKMALGDILTLIRADKIKDVKNAALVVPILREIGPGPAIQAAHDRLVDLIYGHHPTLPESGIASLDDFLMMALPKALRPVEALDRISRIDSGDAILAGMRAVFSAEIKKRNL